MEKLSDCSRWLVVLTADGKKAVEEFKVNGQYVHTPAGDGKPGAVGIAFFDNYVVKR
jgi:hypothetical protein